VRGRSRQTDGVRVGEQGKRGKVDGMWASKMNKNEY
jgi:hypothetical protein